MADIQDPPTYALPVLVDEKSGQFQFNPIWLSWFLQLATFINTAGGLSANHNSQPGLQGGQSSEFYHMTLAKFNELAGTGRVKFRQGAVVTAANDLTLGTDGNYFQVDGATQINLLDNTDWIGGSIVILKFNSTPTVKHNQAASGDFKPIKLAGAADFVASADDILVLVYDATDTAWYQLSRAVI